MLISSLVLYSPCAQEIQKAGMVDHLVQLFSASQNELDLQTQCLFAFYRLACHSATRAALLKHAEIVDVIIRHSRSHNAVLNGIANSVLDALVTFDRALADKLRLPRFDAFNYEWIQVVNTKP
jgi:cell division protein ZapA (FtsZ GTPase activity inhibitor)